MRVPHKGNRRVISCSGRFRVRGACSSRHGPPPCQKIGIRPARKCAMWRSPNCAGIHAVMSLPPGAASLTRSGRMLHGPDFVSQVTSHGRIGVNDEKGFLWVVAASAADVTREKEAQLSPASFPSPKTTGRGPSQTRPLPACRIPRFRTRCGNCWSGSRSGSIRSTVPGLVTHTGRNETKLSALVSGPLCPNPSPSGPRIVLRLRGLGGHVARFCCDLHRD